MKLISIIVPVYHNARSLPDLMVRFRALAQRNPEDFEFIFVDDGSKDDSFQVLQSLAADEPRMKIVKLSRNFGSNNASSAGISQAKGEAVVAISADLQDPPELVDRMLERWRTGYRIVLAARADREDPWAAKLAGSLFWLLFQRFAIPTMPRHGCDFCLIDRVVIEALRDTHEPGAGIAMALWTGFEPAILYYRRQAREQRYGSSMWTFSKKVTYLIDSFVSFSHAPIRAASLIGMLLGMLGVAYAALIIVSRLYFKVEAEGWASLMVAVLVVSGTQLLMIGILGEYLVRLLESSRRRPSFIIDKIVEGGSTNADPEPASKAAASQET
jgi:dolichol-phosphate mannosyltransferase